MALCFKGDNVAQVKIYGLEGVLIKNREKLSASIHESLMGAFSLPENKMFHRFIPLENENFKYPSDRSSNYIIIELSIFEGRSTETKKHLINLLYEKIRNQTGIKANDIEITIFETPMLNWGIRGMPGDELALNYKVKV
jgi:phenylpyruvate tautomerase PptA (4-oxalocrotonate tautomerase family)